MTNRILVAYASKYGATKEIAGKIGEVLRQEGLQVDVIPVEAVKSLEPYQAVILGSAIYVGKWMKEAATFLQANEKVLTAKPVWLFSSGPSGQGDPVKLIEGQVLPADLKPVVDRIHPREIVVFHGNIDLNKVNFIEKFAVKNIVKKPFGDYRDWQSIAAWANRIAVSMKEVEYAR
jgi:menaquinone-dependent protoporphyrinogen oxidase